MAVTKRLLLASSSPRRRELLMQMGLQFEIVAASVDESLIPGEDPAAYVERLAKAKAHAGFRPECVVIGADTSVVVDNEILGKPCGQTEGVEMLLRLSNRVHQVVTSVAVYDGNQCLTETVRTAVIFRAIGESEAQAYWRTGEPRDKAGGYGIQGIGGIFARVIQGSYSAVVGLPIEQTESMLRSLNIDTWSMRIDG
jgi:septum formation protein